MKQHLIDIVRKDNLEDKAKFNLVLTQNERNTPLPEGLFKKFIESINEQDITFYPYLDRFKEKLKVYFNNYPFLLTPGSDTAIKTFFELFELNGKNIVTSNYYFPMYKVYSDIYQAEIKLGCYKGMRLDINSIIRQVDDKTAFIILANPNSPLGDYLPEQEIKHLLSLDIPVLIDEAYIECTKFPSIINLLAEFSNLFITRTFSKGYGAAGLRVGAIISSQENINLLNKFRFMYEIPSISAKYCEFVLDNQKIFHNSLNNSLKDKDKLVKLLSNNFEVVNTDSMWFFLLDNNSRFENFLTKFKISMRKVKLPVKTEQFFFKVNYDPMLEKYIPFL